MRLRDFQKRNAKRSPAMLKRLQDAVIRNGSVFAVRAHSLEGCTTMRPRPYGRAAPCAHQSNRYGAFDSRAFRTFDPRFTF